jgi:hypothetical protein
VAQAELRELRVQVAELTSVVAQLADVLGSRVVLGRRSGNRSSRGRGGGDLRAASVPAAGGMGEGGPTDSDQDSDI